MQRIRGVGDYRAIQIYVLLTYLLTYIYRGRLIDNYNKEL